MSKYIWTFIVITKLEVPPSLSLSNSYPYLGKYDVITRKVPCFALLQQYKKKNRDLCLETTNQRFDTGWLMMDN